MEKMLTTKDVAEIFKVKERTITQKFIKQGLKYFPIGQKDYRYDLKDVEEFKKQQMELANEITNKPIKSKYKSRHLTLDFEKMKINKQLNKVV